MENEEVLNDIIEIIKANESSDEKDITPDSLIKDVISGSINFVKLMIELEDRYGLDFTNDEIKVDKYGKISDLIETVNKKISQKN